MNKPRVTVLMPAYNAEKYIKQSIDSILNQSFLDFLFLIIDDGSSDGTENIIRSYNDRRICFVKNETNIGIKETLNKGVMISDTEYIARMDADDIALPKRLEWQLEYMDSNKDIGVSGGHFEFFGHETSIVKMPMKDNEIKAKLFFFSGFCHPTVIMRTEVLKKNNFLYGNLVNFNDNFGHKILELEDFALWHKLKHVTQFGNVDKVLIKYRKEGQNISAKNIKIVHDRKKVIYYYLLNEIGISASNEEEVMFLYTLQYFKDDPKIENIKKYKQFLKILLEVNKQSGVYSDEQFEVAVNRIWEQFFYFLTTFSLKYVLNYWKVSRRIQSNQLLYYVKYKLKYGLN